MLAIVAPGQGAQTPGFLAPWLAINDVAARLRWWSAATDLDLIHYGTDADADAIRDTAVAQPLLVGSGLAAAAALGSGDSGDLTDITTTASVFAGHSVGELTAAALTGVLSPEAALVLVRERGRAMAAAAAATQGGMTAILGGDADAVAEKIAAHGLTAANANGAGQVVAAGTTEQLAALAADPPAGARLRPLSVAGAFHTDHMAPAAARLRELADGVTVHDPRSRLISNADGEVVKDGPDMLGRLVAQVASPVRWDLCMQTLSDLGVTAVIELPPAGTLVGLIRRALPGVETLALKTPDDLDAAHALIAKHRNDIEIRIGTTPSWRLAIAPFAGTFEAVITEVGARLEPGAVIGRVSSRRETQDVVASQGGILVELLAADGDPVTPGQPLARMHPAESDDHALGMVTA